MDLKNIILVEKKSLLRKVCYSMHLAERPEVGGNTGVMERKITGLLQQEQSSRPATPWFSLCKETSKVAPAFRQQQDMEGPLLERKD